MFKRTSLAFMLSISAVMANSAIAQTTVRIGYAVPQTSHYGAGANAFCATLEAETQGRYVCQQFPNAALGNERAMVEAVQLGTQEIAFVSSGTVGSFVPDMRVVDIPFLFRDTAHARAVLDGQVGQELLDLFPSRGLMALAWGENGFRHITNSKRPINEPADLRGLKLRTMENRIHIDSFTALGAMPTPMAWPEVYTSLQLGAIDGQENPLSILLSARIWEVQQHVSLTSHVYSPTLLLASPAFWQSLSAADQQALRNAAKAGVAAQRQRVDEEDRAAVATLEQQGMQVARPDVTPFREALAPVFAELAKTYGDLIARIQSVQ